jgi:hypothetical protein
MGLALYHSDKTLVDKPRDASLTTEVNDGRFAFHKRDSGAAAAGE